MSAPHPTGPHSASLNVETGRIFYESETADLDEMEDEEMEWDHMIEISHKNDLGQHSVFDFVDANLPEDYDIFRRRGAYGSFLLLDGWYHFEHEREEEALRSWCEDNSLPPSDEKRA